MATTKETVPGAAPAPQPARRGSLMVKAVFRGQYPALGGIREPDAVFPLEDPAHFSELWMTRDLNADLSQAQAAVTDYKRDKERHETRQHNAVKQAVREGRAAPAPEPFKSTVKPPARAETKPVQTQTPATEEPDVI